MVRSDLVSMAVILGVGGVAAVVALIVIRLRDWRRDVPVFANKVQLWVVDEIITAAVARRLRRNATGTALGVIVGVAASEVWLLLVRPADLNTFIWAVELPLVLVSAGAVPMALALRDQLYVHDEASTRVARTTAVTARDYISPARFWLIPALALAALALLALGFVLSVIGATDLVRWASGPTLWLVGIFTIVMIAGLVAARAVVRQDQPAADSLELAWSDALRAETLRTLWSFEAAIAWLAVVFAGLGILTSLDPPLQSTWAGLTLQLSLNLGIIVASRLFSHGAAYSYFRFRLWSSLGDVGEIVDEDDDSTLDSTEFDSTELDGTDAVERRQ